MKIINEDIGMDLMIGFGKRKKKTKPATYPINRYTINLHKYINKTKQNENKTLSQHKQSRQSNRETTSSKEFNARGSNIYNL